MLLLPALLPHVMRRPKRRRQPSRGYNNQYVTAFSANVFPTLYHISRKPPQRLFLLNFGIPVTVFLCGKGRWLMETQVKRPCLATNTGMCMNAQKCCSTHARPLVGSEASQQIAFFRSNLLDRGKTTHLCTNSFHSTVAIIAA